MTPFHRLDDVCELVMGQAPDGEAYNLEGRGWPLIAGAGDFGDVYPDVKKFTLEATKLSQVGDIILGIRATIGEKVVSDKVYCLGRGVAALRPKSELDARYLWHWLTHIRRQLASKARGATFKQVTREDIGELEIILPSPSAQKRIASILDQADALRAKRRTALENVVPLTVAVFLDLFGEPNLNPKNFNIESLGDHLVFVTSGSRGWAEFYGSSGSRFIRSLDVQMNYISDQDVVFVEPPDNAEARRTKVGAGDVLLTITGSRIGRVATVTDDLAGSYISQHVAILRVDPNRLDPRFLSFFLSLEVAGQRQIRKFQYGQTKPGLNFEQIRRFQILVPPIEMQREFVRCATALERMGFRYHGSLAEMDALFEALQFRAFRGEL
jgi:type I restriction enzyme S subunit